MNGILARLRRGLREESGQALVFGVIFFAAVLPCVGLAIDIGQIRYEQQQMQSAVDAAALAGALEVSACGGTAHCPAMTAAAQSALKENGFTVGTPLTQCATPGSGLSLTVNNGPCALGSTDPNNGLTSSVEAVLTGPVSTIFANMIGIRSIRITVRAEAATHGGIPPNCLVVSANSAATTQGITLQGGSTGGINTPGCGIYDDDSNSSNALVDNSGTVTSSKFMVVGGIQNSGATFSSTPKAGAPVLADPLSYLSTNNDAPTAGSCTGQSSTPANGATLTQGTFCSGITLNSNVSVTLSAGTYYIENGIAVDSGATLTATAGVTLYVASGSVGFNSTNSTVKLVAPTTGTLAGIALWQASGDTNGISLNAGSTSEYNGAIYAPTAQLTLNSGSNAATCTVIDVGSVMLDSGSNFYLGDQCQNYSSSQAFGSGGSTSLVE